MLSTSVQVGKVKATLGGQGRLARYSSKGDCHAGAFPTTPAQVFIEAGRRSRKVVGRRITLTRASLMAGNTRKEYRCATCGKVSTRAFNHQEHERTHNPPEQRCPYCPKIFKSLSSLAGHVARHKREGSRVNRSSQRPEAGPSEMKISGVRSPHPNGIAEDYDPELPQRFSESKMSHTLRVSHHSPSYMSLSPEMKQPLHLPPPGPGRGPFPTQLPPLVPYLRSVDCQNPMAYRGGHRGMHHAHHVQLPKLRLGPGPSSPSPSEISPLPADWSDSEAAMGSDVSEATL